MNDKRYYQLVKSGNKADLYIYGDVVPYSDGWFSDESDVTAYSIIQELQELDGIDELTVHIKSFGGDVNEGLAIYNTLRGLDARVITRVDGFACSIASVIAMAGVERVMCESSLLMIHNPWTSAWGANAAQMRKLADDLDKIAAASKAAYLARASISAEELDELMDAETWITPEEALEWGFATSIETFEEADAAPSQCARKSLFELVCANRQAQADPAAAATVEAVQQSEEDPDDDDGDDGETTPAEPEEPEEPEDPDEPDDPEQKSQEACASVFMALDKVLSERSTHEDQ